ncbi:MAG: hypothetical protein HLUCCO02_02525 [Idiomarinaceae bacterium HL-53]|nr:MAG: hypothetical protein HLUCCO02_02525 [Idiomarinaceae bacterium HL-53]CUS48895.1 Uncharacterized conserved protein YbgA, DUF1722 family [Idiomarinaceae bacterium HL-53]
MVKVGISACLMGDEVRFDGGHKKSSFCANELIKHVEFVKLCPEIGIGLPTPRPSIRLEWLEDDVSGSSAQRVRAYIPKTSQDVTAELQNFAITRKSKLSELRGYILCAKSPSCGMERVRVYKPETKFNEKTGVGIFVKQLQEMFPVLPMEEDGRLNDPLLRENFILRVFVYADWKSLRHPRDKKELIAFHTRHKLLLLAHNQPLYRALGKKLGEMREVTSEVAEDYIQNVMQALAKPALRNDHTNVLQHAQGYFKQQLTATEKEALAELILAYHDGLEPLSAPLALIKHYQRLYPHKYLAEQSYFSPYPASLKLRYGL